MKKRAAIAVLALVIALATVFAASAHPPKWVSASWDASGQILNIRAQHGVNDPAKHFILSLTVFEGNKQLLQKQYTSQSSADYFQDSVALKGLPSGTKIRIQVVCNIMGSTETEFTIP